TEKARYGGKRGSRKNASVAHRRHIGESARQKSAADAIADRIDVVFPDGPLDRIGGSDRTFDQIVGKVLTCEFRTRVDPGNHENRVPLIDAPLDERVLRLEI